MIHSRIQTPKQSSPNPLTGWVLAGQTQHCFGPQHSQTISFSAYVLLIASPPPFHPRNQCREGAAGSCLGLLHSSSWTPSLAKAAEMSGFRRAVSSAWGQGKNSLSALSLSHATDQAKGFFEPCNPRSWETQRNKRGEGFYRRAAGLGGRWA